MKPILQYVKSNALLITLLGVVGYQQTMLNKLVQMSYVNNEHIVDTYNVGIGLEYYAEATTNDTIEIAVGIDSLQSQLFDLRSQLNAMQ